jgi:tRNA 2-thiouridine synthesizing protein D
MGKLLLILCETPFQSENVDHAIQIAEKALEKGHEVSIFLFMDGVYNMIKTQNGNHFNLQTVSSQLQRLLARGAEITCCRLCKELRGLNEEMTPEGIRTIGIGELNDEISDADVVLSFTG